METDGRLLHWVFKISDRTASIAFFKNYLGMKVLRHEEFHEGCAATCNGPYDGKWSKTIMGYGPEVDHFVLELTYNYGVKEYKLGNEFNSIVIRSKSLFRNIAKKKGLKTESFDDCCGKGLIARSPDGYVFKVVDEEKTGDPIASLNLNCTDLESTTRFWSDILKMKKVASEANRTVLTYSTDQAQLSLFPLPEGCEFDRGSAFGRVAISVPSDQLKDIQQRVRAADELVLTPLISLDTPGKATVQVIIVADPDIHEVCFVGDEAFRELSIEDSEAETLLSEAMAADKSKVWWEKKRRLHEMLNGNRETLPV